MSRTSVAGVDLDAIKIAPSAGHGAPLAHVAADPRPDEAVEMLLGMAVQSWDRARYYASAAAAGQGGSSTT